MFSANASQVSNDVKYIEDFCSVYLRTGTGASQTVTTGVKENTGALVISKSRSAATDWAWYDTFRGATYDLVSNSTAAQTTQSQGLTTFNADGHTWGTLAKINTSGATYVDTVLKPTPKFFDVVTYTGNAAVRTIAHSLGSVPGSIWIKRTNSTSNWAVYHKDLGVDQGYTGKDFHIFLNLTNAQDGISDYWNNTAPTSTVFSLGANAAVNTNGATYVAYLFAHNAGGFGLTGTDNVISCGSFTTDSSGNASVTLGYEPQFLIQRMSANVDDWYMLDIMRGSPQTFAIGVSNQKMLKPNLSNAEADTNGRFNPNATGFTVHGLAGNAVHIYIAIRRGPMKVPTSGTSVFSPTAWTGSMATRNTTTGFVTDLNISRMRQNFSSASNLGAYWETRLTGATKYLHSDATAAEASQTDGLTSFASNTGLTFGADSTVQAWNYDNNYRNWSFKRAPSYMDVVCYTGTGSATTFSHNLGVAPELMIVKDRTYDWGSDSWAVYSSALGATKYLALSRNVGEQTSSSFWNDTAPTASVFTVGTIAYVNAGGDKYVAYLFATCAGVSKVGSYTGNGSSQTINCGFAAGARFVMIKATSTTGNWVCVDTNGINAGVDRAIYMNNADLEDFTYDWIDIDSTGFIVNETATIAANTNGVTYIYLAIA